MARCGTEHAGGIDHDFQALKKWISSKSPIGFSEPQPGLIDVLVEEGAIAWAAVGPASSNEMNIEPDQMPDEVQARLNDKAEELMTDCLETARR